MMNEHGKSDRPVVPAKSPNKAGQPAAEGTEGSGLTKGNLQQQNASRTPSRTDAPSALARVRQAASKGLTALRPTSSTASRTACSTSAPTAPRGGTTARLSRIISKISPIG